MKLKIKGTKEKIKEIELVENESSVQVEIDGVIIARFDDNGDFIFFGFQEKYHRESRWDLD